VILYFITITKNTILEKVK